MGFAKLLSEQCRASLKPKSGSDTTICRLSFVTQQSDEMFCLAVSDCRNDRKQVEFFSFFMPIYHGISNSCRPKVFFVNALQSLRQSLAKPWRTGQFRTYFRQTLLKRGSGFRETARSARIAALALLCLTGRTVITEKENKAVFRISAMVVRAQPITRRDAGWLTASAAISEQYCSTRKEQRR